MAALVVKPHAMKRLRPVLWVMALLIAYILSSGPAMLVHRTSAWRVLGTIYRPLSYLDAYTPAKHFLIPYWKLWIDPDDNPLYFG